jgi:hypothetical protein
MQMTAISRFVIAATLAFALGGTANAHAAIVLDQDNFPVATSPLETGLSSPDNSFRRAQTFTVGVSGTLAKIGVVIRGNASVALRILGTSGGIPLSTSLGEATANAAGAGALTFFDLVALDLEVVAGDVLAFEPVQLDGWGSSHFPSSYAGGQLHYINTRSGIVDWRATPNHDFGFETYVSIVDVPAPGALMLFAGSLALLALCRRRRG